MEDLRGVDTAVLPEQQVFKSHVYAQGVVVVAPIRGRCALRWDALVILDVDVHDVRCQSLQSLRAIVFAADKQVRRLVGEAEVRPSNRGQVPKDLVHGFEGRVVVALVYEPDAAPSGLVRGLLSRSEVRRRLQTDPDEVAADDLRDVQARPVGSL